MGVLEGLKRRLLGGSNRGQQSNAAGQARRAHSAADTATTGSSTAGSKSPLAQRPSSPHAGSKPSPLAATLELPSPRRIPLGGLHSQLAALQQRYAELPQHMQQPSRAVLAARLAAARHDTIQAAACMKSAKTAAVRSPRKGAIKAGKAGLRRPMLRSSPSVWRQSSTAAWAAQAGKAPMIVHQPPATIQTAAGSLKRSKRSKLALLKQRQALRSADSSRPPTGAASDGQGSWLSKAGPESSYVSSTGRLGEEPSEHSSSTGASRTHSEEAAATAAAQGRESAAATVQQAQQESKPEGGSAAEILGEVQHRLAKLTPRVLVAAAELAHPANHAQPGSREGISAVGSELEQPTATAEQRIAPGGSGGSSGSHGIGHNRRSSHGELGLTLAPWAGRGSQLCSQAAQDVALPARAAQLPAHSIAKYTETAAADPAVPASLQATRPAAHPARPVRAGAAVPGGFLPLPFPPAAQQPRLSARYELPLDLLSLHDSASLARSGLHTPGQALLTKRRARSVQEPGREAEGAGLIAGSPPSAAPVAPGSNRAAGKGQGAGQLPALGRRQRPGWNSDLTAQLPAWQPPGQVRRALRSSSGQGPWV